MRQRFFETLDKLVEIDRLAKKRERTAVHGCRPRSFVLIGRHEDHRRLMVSLCIQYGLQFDAAQARHFDVDQHTVDPGAIAIGEKVFRRRIQSALVAARRNEIVKGFADRPIVVNDGYDGCFGQCTQALPDEVNWP